jgi:hypothetical protein
LFKYTILYVCCSFKVTDHIWHWHRHMLTCHCLRFTQFESVFFRCMTGCVTVCRFCVVHYLIICFSLLFSNYLTHVF